MYEKESSPPERYKRYGPPTMYDQHPYGTIIELIPSSLYKEAEYYKQMSKDPNKPLWQKVGNTASTLT